MINAAINEQKAANKADVDVAILHQEWQDAPFDTVQIVERLVAETLFRAVLPEAATHRKIEISVALVGDNAIQQLNKEFRNKDKPTNVLSFESESGDLPDDAEYPLGDIILSYETIKREAEEQNKKFEHHYTHMVLHGLLHLLGYDHIEDDEARTMEAKEIEILGEIGIENPYL